MEVVQRVGVRLLDAARLLVDKEIYLQTNLKQASIHLEDCELKAREELEKIKNVGGTNEVKKHIENKHKAKVRDARKGHSKALKEMAEHTSILENEHHHRMDLEELREARKLLAQTWEFCLLDSVEVNAFVHALQPRRIFVNASLLGLCKTEDELATVLAHEVSHALCKHTEEGMQLEIWKAAATAVIFSMVDPTGGLLAFLADGVIWADGHYNFATQANSREHEHEADTLGINIMAQACYSPRAGVKIMNRIMRLEHGQTMSEITSPVTEADREMIDHDVTASKFSISNLTRSHPCSAERIENLTAMVPLLEAHYRAPCGKTMQERTAFQAAYHNQQKRHPNVKMGAAGGLEVDATSWAEYITSGFNSAVEYVWAAPETNNNADREFDESVPHMKVHQRVVVELDD